MSYSSLMVRSVVWALVVALALAGRTAAQDGAQLLRLNPAVGQEFVWAAVMKTEAVNAVGEFQLDVNLTQQVLARTEQDVTWSMKTTVTQFDASGLH